MFPLFPSDFRGSARRELETALWLRLAGEKTKLAQSTLLDNSSTPTRLYSWCLMLLMLEDDVERVHRFKEVVYALDPNLPLLIWRNAKVMIRECEQYLPAAKLISLDHDLEPEEDGSDSGDGLKVAKFLTSQAIVRPIIIHSSNRQRSDWMEGEFELAGWACWRVAPLGDDWIEVDWRRLAKRAIGRSQK